MLLQLQKVLQKTSGPFPELFRQVEQSARVEEIPRLVAWLSGEDWRQRFVARHALVRIGGACIIRLEELAKEADRPLRKEIRRILEAISQETEARLSKAVHRVLCSHDQCWLSKFRISVARVGSFRFYGCRQCYQTQQFTPHSGPIGAVLDKKMRREAETRDGQLRINWLRRQKRTRALFDFDWIEIIRSPDIEVHRFCMDVHGDMDPVRRRRYKKMLCRVCSGVDLCPNTWQLLRHTFGRVETVAEPGQCR